MIMNDVVGFALDQIQVSGERGGKVGVDVAEEGGEEEEGRALRVGGVDL